MGRDVLLRILPRDVLLRKLTKRGRERSLCVFCGNIKVELKFPPRTE